MPFVQAKCPNCGGILAVDNTNDAAVCQFCDTPFIVEKAINNYNITLTGNINIENATVSVTGGPTAKNLLERTKQYYDSQDYENALIYADRVLDLEADNEEAKHYHSILAGMPEEDNLVVHRNFYYLLAH